MKALVTGASGFLGSHLVDRLLERGDDVRALLRPTSDTSYLEGRGIEGARGDISERATLLDAVAGVDVVYHVAALVSDWAPWSEFKRVTIDGTRNMLRAAAAAGVPRFLHVSTDGVYALSTLRGPVTEESPLEKRFGWLDYYRRSKLAAEKIARRYHERGKIPVTIVRPALLFGERDAAMLPGTIAFLRSKSAAYMGSGHNQLPYVYAGDVADACVLAATTDKAIDETYNVVSPEYVTQRDLYEAVAECTSLRPPTRTIPFRAVYALALGMEVAARVRGWEHRPDLTRFAASLIGMTYNEDSSKLQRELGWQPTVTMREAVQRSIEWTRAQRRQPVGS